MEQARFTRLPAAALVYFASSLPLLATELPDAGQSLESLRRTPALPAKPAAILPEESPVRPSIKLPPGITVSVQSFHITGAQAFTTAELLGLIEDAAGKDLTLADIQGLANRITKHYRDHGYLLAKAYIPVQEIRDGLVEITVLEGRLGKVSVDNRSMLSNTFVEVRLANFRAGDTVDSAHLEQNLLLLNDLAGVEVKSTLKPGASVGTTDLDIRLEGERRLTGAIDLNNYGNRYTGDVRGGLTLNVNNPAGRGDTLALRGVSSGSGLNYGRLAYQLPLGTQGTQLGAAYSDMRYRLGKVFTSLQANGKAEIGSLYLLHPFLRSRLSNVNGQLAFERKHLEDRVDASATVTDKTLDIMTIGLSGDSLDVTRGGLTSWSANLVNGTLDLDPASRALDAAGHRTQDGYTKLGYQLARLQRLTERINLYGLFSGQRARKNLDSSEKFSLGGPYAVRAYPQGESPCDDAWLASLELRYTPAPAWQLTLFADGGAGHLHHSPLSSDANNSRALSGAGVGFAWSHAARIGVSGFLAWRTDAAPTSDTDRTPRVWVQGVKYF